MGTPTTVGRALRLINESALDDGGVEILAERLGVSARHLSRLFLKHLGATPTAVAQTRRLHFAKKLMDETTLPMGQLAIAAGFGSVRRFNAAIRNTYNRTPTQIRHIGRQARALPENHYSFSLRFRPPIDWKGMLTFLASNAIPGVEAVNDDKYQRTISLEGQHRYFETSLDKKHNALSVRDEFGNPRSLYLIIERIRLMFDLSADWEMIAQDLKADDELGWRLKAAPGLRVPGCWNGFELATHAILRQQGSAEEAMMLSDRIVKTFGRCFSGIKGLTHLFPLPKALANAALENIGLSKSKTTAIRALAHAVCRERIKFEQIVDIEDFMRQLREIPGLDASSVQYIALRALRDPDAFPSSDPDLLEALDLNTSHHLEKRAAAWRPWRAYAAIYVWHLPRKIEKVCPISTPLTVSDQRIAFGIDAT